VTTQLQLINIITIIIIIIIYRKAGQNPPRVVAPIEEEEEVLHYINSLQTKNMDACNLCVIP
jgi:hypothetical protein